MFDSVCHKIVYWGTLKKIVEHITTLKACWELTQIISAHAHVQKLKEKKTVEHITTLH